MTCTRLALLALLMAVAGCASTPKSWAGKKRVKVFLLSGQSNMTGRGMQGWPDKPLDIQKHTLFGFVNRPENKEKYAFLRSGPKTCDNGWTIRDDVFITIGDWPHLTDAKTGKPTVNRRHGGLSPYYGGRKSDKFGPEFAIGHLLGDFYDEPVLLVKVSYGGNSLGKNFRPPSSGGTLGDKYPKVLQAYRDAIAHIGEIIPDYDPKDGYELVGFLWNQGLSDGGEEFSKEYEQNLANLIKDLRRDLHAPNLPTVIAVSGNWGWDKKDLIANHANHRKKHPTFTVEESQKRIEGLERVQQAQVDISRRPEFKGTVATAETRDFWRSRSEFGGHGTEEHWCANGVSYWLIGESMGNAMIKLVGGIPTLGVVPVPGVPSNEVKVKDATKAP